MVYQMTLRFDHICNGDDGKIKAVGFPRQGIDGRRPGAALASADHVRADDKVAVRVEGFARTDHDVPPAGG
jgi:hypothetical protein